MLQSIRGKVKAISETEKFKGRNDKEYIRQQVFIDAGETNQTTGQYYANDLLFTFLNYKGGDIRSLFKVGDAVEVSYSLRGRSYEKEPGKKKFYIEVSPYRIAPDNGGRGYQQPYGQPYGAPRQQYAPQPAPAPSPAPGQETMTPISSCNDYKQPAPGNPQPQEEQMPF